MTLPKKAVLGILADNLRLRQSVLPLSRRAHTRWENGLDIPRGGETVLYTGQMYQLTPYIDSMAGMLAVLEDSWITNLMGMGLVFNRVLNLSRFMALPSKATRERYDRQLRNVAGLLREANVTFGYLYEDDLYAGALVHDEGVDAGLPQHARIVQERLQRHGVQRVITVDPHTTHMLRTVYPKILDGFDVEVQSYLEVLANSDLPVRQALSGGVTIHDSCVYARYEGVIEAPRELLRQVCDEVREPEQSGLSTFCCGGPIESLFPKRAHEIASRRVEQLTALDSPVAVMCPICMVNFAGTANGDGADFRDISEILAEAMLPNQPGNQQPCDHRKDS